MDKKKPRALDHKDKIRTKEMDMLMDMLINSQFQSALTTRAVQLSSETQEQKNRKYKKAPIFQNKNNTAWNCGDVSIE